MIEIIKGLALMLFCGVHVCICYVIIKALGGF